MQYQVVCTCQNKQNICTVHINTLVALSIEATQTYALYVACQLDSLTEGVIVKTFLTHMYYRF